MKGNLCHVRLTTGRPHVGPPQHGWTMNRFYEMKGQVGSTLCVDQISEIDSNVAQLTFLSSSYSVGGGKTGQGMTGHVWSMLDTDQSLSLKIRWPKLVLSSYSYPEYKVVDSDSYWFPVLTFLAVLREWSLLMATESWGWNLGGGGWSRWAIWYLWRPTNCVDRQL